MKDVKSTNAKNRRANSTSRRNFLKRAGISAALSAGALVPGGLLEKAEAAEISPFVNHPNERANQLRNIRFNAAQVARANELKAFPHATNADEVTYAAQGFAGNFTKTLPHGSSTGLVSAADYQKLQAACAAGTQTAFDAVPAGGSGKLNGPLSPLVFQMEGDDSPVGSPAIVPPAINSAAAAAELVELYWEAYLRDVPFINYGSNPLVSLAAADLNKLSAFSGPKPVTPSAIFRYPFIGATDGPYVSQILYQTHRLDGVAYVPKINSSLPVADPNTGQVLTGPGTGLDFMTNFAEYLFVEDGNGPIAPSPNVIDPTPRFLRSIRDLGALAASDSVYSIYFRAALILSALGISLDPNNPYATDTRIDGFSTFSYAWMEELLGTVHKTEAHAYYGKWYIHRQIRPEQFGNLTDGILNNRFQLNPSLHPDLFNSSVLPLIFQRNRQLNVKRGLGTTGSFLLPQQLPDGSPNSPNSPSGHAFAAGACVTILKAVLDVGTPTSPRPWPVTSVEASADGLTLVNTNDSLTVLGELNKLAANVADGRNMSGVNTRVGGNMLGLIWGENIAISLLQERAATYPETFKGWTLTKFDGTTTTITGNPPPSGDDGGDDSGDNGQF
jgi:hypothetical protein